LSNPSRRDFLINSGLSGAGLLAFHGFSSRFSLLAANASDAPTAVGYGSLSPAKANNTGELLLALPPDFQYTVFSRTGTIMSDGRPTPRAHDGMAAFRVGRELRLVRNHEINNYVGKPDVVLDPKAYDPLAGGGTTTLVIDPTTREVVKDFVSLSGTLVNCAGGPTPWNSWISCEETVLGPREFVSSEGGKRGGFSKHHGYCFEVSAKSNRAVTPVPLKEMGRFVHEALAVDPRSGTVYLTEDIATGGFYRFVPRKRGRLAAGGQLQMLAIQGKPNYDTRSDQLTGVDLPVAWVDIRNPDPPEAEMDNLAVYKQGFGLGAATFRRLEGCFYGNGRIYFTSTSGGDKKMGQVWQYVPSAAGHGSLTLLFEVTDPTVLNMPDNICLAGKHKLVICEDNGVANHLRILTSEGQIVNLAKNIVPGFETREFAGVTFSPDGQTLFVNVQVPGLTLAIWGPWDRF
jgi:secreted PhoX family phosphatase